MVKPTPSGVSARSTTHPSKAALTMRETYSRGSPLYFMGSSPSSGSPRHTASLGSLLP